MSFADAPDLQADDAETLLFGDALPPLPPAAMNDPLAGESLRKSVIMSPAEERLMFYRYNYAKMRLAEIQQAAIATGLDPELADLALHWHGRAWHCREYIARTNIGLVWSMLRKGSTNDPDFYNLFSECSMALVRSIEKFDVSRGFKFSTYCCRAILKSLSREAYKSFRYRTHFPVQYATEKESVPEDYLDTVPGGVSASAGMSIERREIYEKVLGMLSDKERMVFELRILGEKTLEEVGAIIGVTKERIRQIQLQAAARITKAFDPKIVAAMVG